MAHAVLPARTPATPPVDDLAIPGIARLRLLGRYAAGAGLIVSCWAASLAVSTRVTVEPVLHESALFLHLAAIIAGMGAVLTLDWLALRWLFGTLSLRALVTTAAECHLVIWAGWAGLVFSGALLSPDLSSPVTQVKILAVLAVGLNGLAAHAMQQRLARTEVVGIRLLLVAGAVATASQAGWWTAVAVGFLNAR